MDSKNTYSRDYKGTVFTLTLTKNKETPWKCSNGKSYRSPSAAGRAITKKQTLDGPAWWGMKPRKAAAKKPAAKLAQRKVAKRVDRTGAPVAAPAPTVAEGKRGRAARIAALRQELAGLLKEEAADLLAQMEAVRMA